MCDLSLALATGPNTHPDSRREVHQSSSGEAVYCLCNAWASTPSLACSSHSAGVYPATVRSCHASGESGVTDTHCSRLNVRFSLQECERQMKDIPPIDGIHL